jgi:hypothetical protein
VTIASRPSFRVRRPELITDLPDGLSGIFLREGMDSATRETMRDLPVRQINHLHGPTRQRVGEEQTHITCE